MEVGRGVMVGVAVGVAVGVGVGVTVGVAVGVGVGVDTFLLFRRAVSGVAREGRGEEEGCHYGGCDDRVSGVHSCCRFQVGIIGCNAVRQTCGGVQDGGR